MLAPSTSGGLWSVIKGGCCPLCVAAAELVADSAATNASSWEAAAAGIVGAGVVVVDGVVVVVVVVGWLVTGCGGPLLDRSGPTAIKVTMTAATAATATTTFVSIRRSVLRLAWFRSSAGVTG